MAYMKADTNPKVGFRPYYQTNPFPPSHLSGVFHPWVLDANGPGQGSSGSGLHGVFDPWKLHADHAGQGLGYLGDYGNDLMTAVQELENSGHISQAQADQIISGSLSLKQVVGIDPTDQSSWTDLVGVFRETNSDLIALEQAFTQAGPQPGNSAFLQLGRDLIAKRQQYSAMASDFVHYYTLVTGSTPAGLSGLGIIPVVVWVAGAAVFLVTAAIALYALRDWSKTIDVNAIKAAATQTSVNTQQQMITQAAALDASGNHAAATQLRNQAVAIGPAAAAPMDLSSWFMGNAKWIGLAAVGMVVAGPMSQGLFGGKRR